MIAQPVFLALLLALAAGAASPVAAQVATTRLRVETHPDVEALACRQQGRRESTAKEQADRPALPRDEDLRPFLRNRASAAAATLPLPPPRDPGTYRMAIWGDSHIAAGFFTDELVRASGFAPTQAGPRFLPATFMRAGVRLPLRRACVSGEWRYESAHSGAAAAAHPGPGLADLVARESGAELALDLRAPATAGSAHVRLLLEDVDGPVRIAVAVDGGPFTEVVLQEAAGPTAIELSGAGPLSVVRLRLLGGSLRFHGLELDPGSRALQLDVFGYPGATVAAWRGANTQQLRAWYAETRYDVVALAYGTNEASVQPFDVDAYRRQLGDAVLNLRRVFPTAACVLLAPGDRGTLVRPSSRGRLPANDLLRHSRVHETIGRIQSEVARETGCQVWSALDAMGGPGSAYLWAREQPPLMAPDLVHFTVRGYQQLGRAFSRALRWDMTRPAPPR